MTPVRCLVLLVCLTAFLCSAGVATAAELPQDLRLALAVTKSTENPPSTSLFLYDVSTKSRMDFHADSGVDRRVIVRIAGSDIIGAGRAVSGQDIYVMMGPATVDPEGTCADTFSRLRLAGDEMKWEPLFFVPLCFSDASPYGLWNRAPIFAVDPNQGRVALPAMRVGETRLETPSIRVLSATGEEEWQFRLPGKWFQVTDLAWSPNGEHLAYAVLPGGDEHTLDESHLPTAGVYLADIAARTTRLIYRCYADALAWGPKPGQITVAARQKDIWGPAGIIRVVAVADSGRVEEFSAPAAIQALAYSDDAQWLAVQSAVAGGQIISVYPTSDGWGDQVYSLPAQRRRLALLGWVRANRTTGDL